MSTPPPAVRRVLQAVSRELGPAEIRALLRTMPEPAPGAEARVLARAGHISARPTARTGRGWRWPVVIAGSLTGSLALAAVSIGVLSPLLPRDLDEPLDAVHQVGGTRLRPSGEGSLQGSTAAPVVVWEQGVLEIDTTDALQVRTREAMAWVEEGAAQVERDALGTRWRVDRVGVRVACEGGEPVSVEPGDEHLCRPVSAEGMLGRVRRLSDEGAAADRLLDEIAHGLTLPSTGPVATVELAAQRVDQLERAGRSREALDAARSWLDAGHQPRRDDVEWLAASLSLTLEGCDGARPHLEALADRDSEASAVLEACDARR